MVQWYQARINGEGHPHTPPPLHTLDIIVMNDIHVLLYRVSPPPPKKKKKKKKKKWNGGFL